MDDVQLLARILGPRHSLFDLRARDVTAALAALRRDREQDQSSRDEWGNWDGQFAQDPAALVTAGFDSDNRRGPWSWQGRGPFALVLSHDVDSLDPGGLAERLIGLRHTSVRMKAILLLGLFRRTVLGPRMKRWDFSSWLDCEERHGYRSTWFVFPEDPNPRSEFDCCYRFSHSVLWEPGRPVPLQRALRDLCGRGHEVGLHGSIHSATDAEQLRTQRQQLSRFAGHEIVSGRQHYLRFDPLLTPSSLEAAGFEVDSSVGMNRHVGFRAQTSFPHFLCNGRNVTNVLEVPLVVQDGALFSPHALNLDYSGARTACLRVMDEVERHNGTLTLLFHPDSLHDARRWDLYCVLLEEAKRRGAWGPVMSELRRAWLALDA